MLLLLLHMQPENCMIERSTQRLKLIDFGLSKVGGLSGAAWWRGPSARQLPCGVKSVRPDSTAAMLRPDSSAAMRDLAP
jgi:serine/threonine protein kinase